MSKPPRARYRTTNWQSYNAALGQKGLLLVWFDPGMQWLSAPTSKRGRQPMFSDPAIQACLTLKGVFKLPLRETTSMVASLFEMARLDWPVPDFSTLSPRQKTLLVEIPCQPSSGPLHLLIDSMGIKAVGGAGASMVLPSAASGERSTWAWTSDHLRSAPSKGPGAGLEMRPCFPNCWRRYHPTK